MTRREKTGDNVIAGGERSEGETRKKRGGMNIYIF